MHRRSRDLAAPANRGISPLLSGAFCVGSGENQSVLESFASQCSVHAPLSGRGHDSRCERHESRLRIQRSRAAHTPKMGGCGMLAHGPRIGPNVTAANDRSVWYAPPTGWVTVLAGLLARGSLSCVRPSQFPSGRHGRGLAAYSYGGSRGIGSLGASPRSLLPPRCEPGNQFVACSVRNSSAPVKARPGQCLRAGWRAGGGGRSSTRRRGSSPRP